MIKHINNKSEQMLFEEITELKHDLSSGSTYIGLKKQINSNINKVDEYGCSLLHEACRNGYYFIVKLLLCNKADVTLTNNYNLNALHFACILGNQTITEMVLAEFILAGGDINISSNNGKTPLIYACENLHYGATLDSSCVKLLIDAGADILATDIDKNTAYHYAYHNTNLQITKYMESLYPDIVNLKNSYGYTAKDMRIYFNEKAISN